jgi:hypothetical protein
MGNREQMLYTDDKGELFIGSAKDVRIGKTYEVEVDPLSATQQSLSTK